jgi:tight adherence protein C
MALLFIIGTILLGVSVVLLLRAVAAPSLRIAAQMRQVETYGYAEETAPIEGKATRPLAQLAERVGRGAAARASWLKPLSSSELLAAGKYELSADTFHGYRIVGSVGLGGFMLFVAVAGSAGPLLIALAILTALIAWVFPAAAIRTRGQKRLDRIDRDLPDLIDLLTVTIEAGLGFGGSLQLVANRFNGPLGDELRLALQEQTMGLATEEALEHMLERCDTPSVRAFVRAVLQGNALGVSIGAMLRNVAAETRKRRRALARERAQKAPLKLLFPLVFLIFPAMLVVLLYPAAYNIIQTIGGG